MYLMPSHRWQTAYYLIMMIMNIIRNENEVLFSGISGSIYLRTKEMALLFDWYSLITRLINAVKLDFVMIENWMKKCVFELYLSYCCLRIFYCYIFDCYFDFYWRYWRIIVISLNYLSIGTLCLIIPFLLKTY
jgi:hypothetical protein